MSDHFKLSCFSLREQPAVLAAELEPPLLKEPPVQAVLFGINQKQEYYKKVKQKKFKNSICPK